MARTTRGGWPHRPQLRRGAAATELCREGAEVGGHGAHSCWLAPPAHSHKPVASRNGFCGAAQRPVPRHLSLQVASASPGHVARPIDETVTQCARCKPAG